jgi:hypothetical protein
MMCFDIKNQHQVTIINILYFVSFILIILGNADCVSDLEYKVKKFDPRISNDCLSYMIIMYVTENSERGKHLSLWR